MEYKSSVEDNKTWRPMALGQCPPSSQGITSAGKLVRFVFSSIRAKNISVAGTFNNWDPAAHALKKDLVGVWRVEVYLKPGVYQYRFQVDGEWVNDQSARDKVPNEFGTKNTVLEVK